MKKFVKKLLDLFSGGKDGVDLNSDQLTNKRLLKELTTHFKTMLDNESVGQRMLYPMSFNVLMDPTDYNSREQYLPGVVPEVVVAFYKIIDKMRQKYPNYTPPARYWYFQFSPCRLETVDSNGSAPLIVRKGHIATVANLYTFDITETNNLQIDTNTRVSIKLDDSNVMNDVNVNWNAIRNLDILGAGTFKVNFDMSLPCDSEKINVIQKNNDRASIAELSYSHRGRNYRWLMKVNLINISGRNEKRRGDSFFILEHSNIQDSHVQIKYIQTGSKFQIAAFGPTRLNERKLTESNGGNIQWYDLANNSEIFINNEVSIKFERK